VIVQITKGKREYRIENKGYKKLEVSFQHALEEQTLILPRDSMISLSKFAIVSQPYNLSQKEPTPSPWFHEDLIF